MAEYIPNSVVRVLRNVPLDNTYTDVRWFGNASEQIAFFTGKTKKTYTKLTYQRVNSAVQGGRPPLTCRVEEMADNLHDCNYLMFQNTNFGVKWFYAFIKQVNYVNPNVTEIVYEIDYVQSFMFEMQIKPSFVEREHSSAVDESNPFKNTVPEPIDVDHYIIRDKKTCYIQDEFGAGTQSWIVVAIAPANKVEYTPGEIWGIKRVVRQAQGALYGGIFSGAEFKYFPSFAVGEVNSFLNDLNNQGLIESVIAVFQTALPPDTPNGHRPWASGLPLQYENITTPLNSHRIRNKKLYTYPFSFFRLFSTSGGETDLRPELCNLNTDLACELYYSCSAESNFALVPHYDSINENFQHAVGYSEAVQCCWVKDNFATWQAQNALGNAIRAGTAVTKTLIGGTAMAESKGKLGGSTLLGGIQDALSLAADTYKASKQPNVSRGTPMSGSLNLATGRTGFEVLRYTPNADMARRIDSFFDMFGYAKNELKMPNLKTRQAWNFVKCNDVVIVGSVPVEGMATIKNAFNNGIRLWHVDAVGDYSIENPPI